MSKFLTHNDNDLQSPVAKSRKKHERLLREGEAVWRTCRRIGAPGKIRTPDPLIRSQVLYPAELPAQYKYYKLKIGKKELIIFFFPRGHIP